MSLLTDQFLSDIARSVNPDLVVDRTTLAYIRALLDPWEQELRQLDNVPEMSSWLDHALPEGYDDELKPNADEPQAFIYDFLSNLAQKLFMEADVYVKSTFQSRQVLPWDVRATIFYDVDLLQLFPGDEYTLPVQISINRRTFDHQISRALAGGILDFYYFLRQDGRVISPLVISIFGEPLRETFNRGYIDRGQLYEETRGIYGPYMMTFRNHGTLRFDSLDYLQGMITAAQWLGTDIYYYVSDLMVYDSQSGKWVSQSF